MSKNQGSAIECFASLLALYNYRMDDNKTIVFHVDDEELKFRGSQPLLRLQTLPQCPQFICVRLGEACFHVVLEKDTLEILSPVISPFMKDRAHIVRFILYLIVLLMKIPSVGVKHGEKTA
jgi:hypothetical protein